MLVCSRKLHFNTTPKFFDATGGVGAFHDSENYTHRGVVNVKELWFISRANHAVGCVGLYPTGQGSCEIRKMYLLKPHRGAGLGKRLLEHALDEAKARGFTHVTLETASVLAEAIALYEQYGFRPFTPKHLAQRCDQAYCLELGSRH